MITGFEGRHRAFVEVQQGCNHRCTYCIVPYARGANRSVAPEKIINQIKILLDKGFKEICLTGVDVCSYEPSFSDLVKTILQNIPELPSLQFGSLDPAAIDDKFIELVKNYKNIHPHFHFSIQSGDNLILKRMGRRHSREDVINLCHKLREVRNDSTFGADFICGFPTETEEQFSNTMKLVEEANIDNLHVFPYSERPGTPAAKMPQVPVNIRRQRAEKLRNLRKE
jgi:threonylcarbamoyladenosine tRNA methylthiotransferase MtaB